VTALLRPHTAALSAHLHDGDPRVVELVRACADLADDVGVAFGEVDGVSLRRDDYALAAGQDSGGRGSGTVAAGVDSVSWSAVPAGIFDAAENTVEWRVETADGATKVVVRVELSGAGLAAGIPVQLRSGNLGGAGVLDADGVATFALVDGQQQPVPESVAWDHDWRSTAVTIGADVEESPETRERIRNFARARLHGTSHDAFLAEVLAAESDY
jgi:hypothetical protein